MTEANSVEEPPEGSPEWRLRETQHTIRIMGELCGYRKPTSPVFGEVTDFVQGSYVLTKEMPEFIWKINLRHKPTTLFPYSDVMHRWYLLNSLLVFRNQPPPMNVKAKYHDPGNYIADNRHLLATVLGFALIEELSFRLSQKWDAQGVVKDDIDNSRLKDETGRQRKYKAGKPISNFHHKLILMEEALPPNMRALLFNMNKELADWGAIKGVSQQPMDLYTRFFKQRNRLAHGARCYGWDGLLISLLVNCIYLSFDQNFQETGRSSVPA